MPEKRMLIVPAELVRKIDENRGDMTQAEFIEFLIDSKEEMRSFEEDMKKLLKSFLDFFVGYGLELGKGAPKTDFEELTARLGELESGLSSEDKRGEAKIKWK